MATTTSPPQLNRRVRLVCLSYVDESRKGRLLQWVQTMVPRLGVEDFTASWQDGLALCYLLDDLCPGLCPRLELLKPHHRVNNCRLAIKLAQRYLGLPEMLITAEEMAIADTDIEMKIIHLLQLIKWKHSKGGATLPSAAAHKARLSALTDPVPDKVVARGTGLKAGIVGRRAKFNILTDSVSFLDLHISIQGPNEINSERITSVNQGLSRGEGVKARHPRSPVTSEEEGRSKVIEDDVGNVFLRQKSIEEDMHQNVIPFDYQCVGEGRFLVTYIPRSSGAYFISIKSHDLDIEGSPFEVKVSDWSTSWNVMPKHRVMSFDMLPSIDEAAAARDMLTSAKVKDEGSRPSGGRNRMAQVSKQLTIMKKRVLKRVMKHNGEEILLTPSPSLSRQSSADVSDLSEDDQSGRGGDNHHHHHHHRKSSLGDIGGSAESQAGGLSPVSGSHLLTTSDQHRRLPDLGRRQESEDFSTNSCNITLSVTSFEDEEEARAGKRASPYGDVAQADTEAGPQQDFPLVLQVPPSPRRSKPKCLTFNESPSTTTTSSSNALSTFSMPPGMYPSSPKRLPKPQESPIHISVRSQLLGPPSSHQTALYAITNARDGGSSGPEDEGGEVAALTANAASHSHVRHLDLLRQSPFSSDEASDATGEFDTSPRHHDHRAFRDDVDPAVSQTATITTLHTGTVPTTTTITANTYNNHHYHPHQGATREVAPTAGESESLAFSDSHVITTPPASSNRQRFEASMTHRERADADDSGDGCSRLVSALTELDPGSRGAKKAVGRTYSDEARLGDVSRDRRASLSRRGSARLDGVRRKSLTMPSAEHDVRAQVPPLSGVGSRLLQSDSLKKTCTYITDRPTTQTSLGASLHRSLSDTSPSPQVSSGSSSLSAEDDDRTQETARVGGREGGGGRDSSPAETPDSDQGDRGRGEGVAGGEDAKGVADARGASFDEGSSSRAAGRRGRLQDGNRRWKTFDGGTVVEHEGDWGSRARWRLSLHGRRTQSFSAFHQLPDPRNPHAANPYHHLHHHFSGSGGMPYSYDEISEFENMSILDKLNDDDEILEVVIESDDPDDVPSNSNSGSASELENDVSSDEREDKGRGDGDEGEDFEGRKAGRGGGEEGGRVGGSGREGERGGADHTGREPHCRKEEQNGDDYYRDNDAENDYQPSSKGNNFAENDYQPNSKGNNFAENDDSDEASRASAKSCLSCSSAAKCGPRGNLYRQERVATNKTSSSESLANRTDGSLTPSVEAGVAGDAVDDVVDPRRFKTIQKEQRRRSGSGKPGVSILVPTAKTDKATQVSYGQIKAQTGWKAPAVRLHRRKKYLKLFNRTTVASPKNDLELKNTQDGASVSDNDSRAFNDTDKEEVGDSGLQGKQVGKMAADANGGAKSTDKDPDSGQRVDPPCQRGEEGAVRGGDGDGRPDHVTVHRGTSTDTEHNGPDLHTVSSEKDASGRDPPWARCDKKPPPVRLSPPRAGVCPNDQGDTGRADRGQLPGSAAANIPGGGRRYPAPPYSRARSDPQFCRARQASHDQWKHGAGLAGLPPYNAHPHQPLNRCHPYAHPHPHPHPPSSRADHVLDWIERVSAGEGFDHDPDLPQRQSTVDTLDSGFENESPIYNSFISGHRRIHRRPYPWSIDLDPSLVRASASSGLVQGDPFTGHRRLTRRPYPWEMDLDPRLIRGSTSSVSTDGGQDPDRLQLTLGVIEAAVHRSVHRILSSSSASSSSPTRKVPLLTVSSSAQGWGRTRGEAGASYSDSELCNANDDVNRRRRVAKRKLGARQGSLLGSRSRPTTGVKEDFFRSLAILSTGPQASLSRVQGSSPDIGETKSDGRYSPYSLTDIPCFELPADAKRIKQRRANSPGGVSAFPHHRNRPTHQPAPSKNLAHTSLAQDSASNSEVDFSPPRKQRATSLTQTPLALRRQNGIGRLSSSPEMTSKLTAMTSSSASTLSWPRHKKSSSSASWRSGEQGGGGAGGERRDGVHVFGALERDLVESDTNTSEDSVGLNFKPHRRGSAPLYGLPSRTHSPNDGSLHGGSSDQGSFASAGSKSSLAALDSAVHSFVQDALRRESVHDSSNPRIVIHRSAQQQQQQPLSRRHHHHHHHHHHPHARHVLSSTSTEEDGYCGFGTTRSQRHELIDHIKAFRGLTERQKSQSPDGSRGGWSLSPSSMEELFLPPPEDGYLSQYSDPFDDLSSLSSASLFAGKASYVDTDLEGFEGSPGEERSGEEVGSRPRQQRRGGRRDAGSEGGDSVRQIECLFARSRKHLLPTSTPSAPTTTDTSPTGSTGSRTDKEVVLSPLQAKVAFAWVKNEAGDDVVLGSEAGQVPDVKDETCEAYGAGLSHGQVGVQNHFQVRTGHSGGGGVTVAVIGPQSHCVTETSVVYTGNNMYDVNFSVTSPGFYVIVVKWGDRSLPDSPYICRVTY